MVNDYCIHEKRIWKVVNENEGIAFIKTADGHDPKSKMIPTNALMYAAKESMKSINIVRG